METHIDLYIVVCLQFDPRSREKGIDVKNISQFGGSWLVDMWVIYLWTLIIASSLLLCECEKMETNLLLCECEKMETNLNTY